MAIEVDSVRRQTPGCQHVAHRNNAGASLMTDVVLTAVTDYLKAEATNGGYETAEDRAADLDRVYDEAANLVGGEVQNWAFVESATRAWNAAQGGLVNPAVQVGDLLRDTPVLYQVDACQSVGQIPVRIEEIGCDIPSFTGRKFVRGPRTTGMVWASDDALSQMGSPAGMDRGGLTWTEEVTISPLASARRFQPYEVFFAGKVGLAAALAYASVIGIGAIAERNAFLAGYLRDGLEATSGIRTHDLGRRRSAIVTFTIDGHEAPARRGGPVNDWASRVRVAPDRGAESR